MNPEPAAPPRIRITKETSDHLECVVSGVGVAYVNGLRRSILSDIPTLAIDLVEILSNDSPISDERIAHRLGLVPLWSADHVDKMLYSCQCDCPRAFCPHCGIRCSLDITNMSLDENLTVHDSDLKFLLKDEDTVNTVRPLCVHDPEHFDPIPITCLAPGQRLNLRCTIRKGNGKLHAKFAPASACFHRPCVTLEVADNLFNSTNLSFLDGVCPRNLFTVDTTAETVVITPDAGTTCIQCGECEKIRADGTENGDNIIRIRQHDDEFCLFIDAIGQIPVRELLISGLQHLEDTIEYIRKQFEQL